MVKADPRRWTRADAQAHPVWDSPIFALTNGSLVQIWQSLELNTAPEACECSMSVGAPHRKNELPDYLKVALIAFKVFFERGGYPQSFASR